jgi:hypothetical protein
MMKAFPRQITFVNGVSEGKWIDDGMDLRDYFAAKAMQLFIKISRDNYNHGNPSEGGFSWVSEMSYKQADAMMKARESHG